MTKSPLWQNKRNCTFIIFSLRSRNESFSLSKQIICFLMNSENKYDIYAWITNNKLRFSYYWHNFINVCNPKCDFWKLWMGFSLTYDSFNKEKHDNIRTVFSFQRACRKL